MHNMNMSNYIESYRKHALTVNQRNLKKSMQEAILCFAYFDFLKKVYCNQVAYIVYLMITQCHICVRAGQFTNFSDGVVFYKISWYE